MMFLHVAWISLVQGYSPDGQNGNGVTLEVGEMKWNSHSDSRGLHLGIAFPALIAVTRDVVQTQL